jgi:hypothetical protein
LVLAGLGLGVGAASAADDRAWAKDGSGVYGYRDSPIQPWTGFHVHDPDRSAPPRVDVGPGPERPVSPPPSDAVVLFDGKDLAKWRASKWRVADSCVEAGDGELTTKENFDDCQIHVEWLAPASFQGPWYNQGNSGVSLMGLYEIQIFDSYHEKIYPDGMAGAIYGQTPPLVNACRPPGQWQTFDIMFVAPRFEGDRLVRPARVTVLHNGVLVQHDEEIHGEVAHRSLPAYTKKVSEGPLSLGAHHCPVRFRNIWLRPIQATATTHPSR